MSELPQAENHISALDKRRERLLESGLNSRQVNAELLLPRLVAIDWTDLANSGDGFEPGRFLSEILDMGESALLSRQRLQQLAQGGLGSEPRLRIAPALPFVRGHRPVDPRLLEIRLKRFFEWTATSAFGQLQPLLQLTLTQVRLFELLPWRELSAVLCFWFGVLPLLEAGYLLPAYTEGHLTRLRSALTHGFAFDTAPLVGLNLDAALRSYELASQLSQAQAPFD